MAKLNQQYFHDIDVQIAEDLFKFMLENWHFWYIFTV